MEPLLTTPYTGTGTMAHSLPATGLQATGQPVLQGGGLLGEHCCPLRERNAPSKPGPPPGLSSSLSGLSQTVGR